MPRVRRGLSVEEAFGDVLRELRTAAGLSQEALGHEIDSGRTYVSELERGEKHVTLRWVLRVAPALGLSAAEIVAKVEELDPDASAPG